MLLQIILTLIAIVLVVILITLKSKNKKKMNKETQEEYIRVKGKKEKIENVRESLESLNRLAKNFFKDYLNIKNELTYSEIVEILKKKNEPSLVDFCIRMDLYLYSGKEISKTEVVAMINQFIVLTKGKKFKAKP